VKTQKNDEKNFTLIPLEYHEEAKNYNSETPVKTQTNDEMTLTNIPLQSQEETKNDNNETPVKSQTNDEIIKSPFQHSQRISYRLSKLHLGLIMSIWATEKPDCTQKRQKKSRYVYNLPKQIYIFQQSKY